LRHDYQFQIRETIKTLTAVLRGKLIFTGTLFDVVDASQTRLINVVLTTNTTQWTGVARACTANALEYTIVA